MIGTCGLVCMSFYPLPLAHKYGDCASVDILISDLQMKRLWHK